jgi:hypothetical protein
MLLVDCYIACKRSWPKSLAHAARPPSDDDRASCPPSRAYKFECSSIETLPLLESSRLQADSDTSRTQLRTFLSMPHHPSEEEAESHVFDKVAKGNPESTASDHPMHHENGGPVKATAADHKSKGPVIPDSKPIPSSASSEFQS